MSVDHKFMCRSDSRARFLSIFYAAVTLALFSFGAQSRAYAEDLSLAGKRIGVAVVGTRHFWDREAFNGAMEMVRSLGGKPVPVDGGRDNAQHAKNHDLLLYSRVDAVITILGDGSVEPKLEALNKAGIPVFTVDHLSTHGLNNTTSDNYYMGSTIGRFMADAIGGEGKVVVFNAFGDSYRICGIRVGLWKYVLQDYPKIEVLQPELTETFADAPIDAHKQTLELLKKYPKGTIDAIHVGCWDQPAIGVVKALRETGRTEIKVTGLDGGPITLEMMAKDSSPFVANVAQQPRKIGETAAKNVARHFAGQKLLPQTFVDVLPVQGPDHAKETYRLLGYGSL